MRQLSHSGQQAINDIAQRHGFSVEGATTVQTLNLGGSATTIVSLVIGTGAMS